MKIILAHTNETYELRLRYGFGRSKRNDWDEGGVCHENRFVSFINFLVASRTALLSFL